MTLFAVLIAAWMTNDATWSSEVAVLHGSDAVVRYQACIEEGYLVIKATHKEGWHTYAMDNELRALDALQGKESLGIEKGIEIKVDAGLELDGSWLQSKPKDFSKPELRWYSFGFNQTALFACRVKSVTAESVIVRVRGQACSEETCCTVDVKLSVPTADRSVNDDTSQTASQTALPLENLIPVKTRDEPAPINP